MAEERPVAKLGPAVCRWRSSAETLDVIEALERIEALLLRLESRWGQVAGGVGRADGSEEAAGREAGGSS